MRGAAVLKLKTLDVSVTALFLGLAVTASMNAQFAGPAVTLTPQTNAPQKPTTDATLLTPGQRDPLINPGDLLTVQVFGVLTYAPPVRVSVDGTVQLPLIGPIRIAGLTLHRAEDAIASRLTADGMYNNPQVTIQVTEPATQFATVAGEMHAIVPLSGERRLLDVLAAAGPMPPTASHTITILRDGQPIVVDLGTDPSQSAQADIQILPGDKILIARVGVVYVLGAFKTQGAIPLQQNRASDLDAGHGPERRRGFRGPV